MAASLNSLMVDDGGQVYYTNEFQVMMETHMNLLRTISTTTEIGIQPNDRAKYRGDLGGLLLFYGQPMKYHWIIMRMNDMVSLADYHEAIDSLLIPSGPLIESLRNVFSTVYSTM